MAPTDEYEQRRRTARRRLVAAGAGMTAVAAAAITLLSVTSDGHSDRPDARGATARTTTPTTIPPAPSTGVTVLPKPRRVVHGVPMGYPHTTLGAVSSAAHYYEALDLLDPAAAQQQAEVIAEPGFATAMGLQAKAGAERLRTAFGLPPDGTSDNADYFAQQARAFRIVTESPDRVALWLLMDDSTSDKGLPDSRTGVVGAVMVWAGGDWRMAVLQQMGTAPRAAEPGSAQAAREGWQALAYEK
ncbi:hypothetical protein [Streptomyces sp. HPF1205]|uniref:hypothetical protein n=1 Tax=Streptomyces sp. HPF1205 TaxID=2873262 RepID=UPI001CECA62A|nr:hypothetical protein [Streptomyces sp. HPF1205]